jgi:hypothetical protein
VRGLLITVGGGAAACDRPAGSAGDRSVMTDVGACLFIPRSAGAHRGPPVSPRTWRTSIRWRDGRSAIFRTFRLITMVAFLARRGLAESRAARVLLDRMLNDRRTRQRTRSSPHGSSPCRTRFRISSR